MPHCTNEEVIPVSSINFNEGKGWTMSIYAYFLYQYVVFVFVLLTARAGKPQGESPVDIHNHIPNLNVLYQESLHKNTKCKDEGQRILPKEHCPFNSKNWFLQQSWRFSEGMTMLGPFSSVSIGSPPSHAIPGDNEEEREVSLCHAFWMDRNEVTVQEFSKFATKTNYTTVAEFYGTSFVFYLEEKEETVMMDKRKRGWWWLEKAGVSWKSKEGPDKARQAVVHVSHDDALNFCAWRGGRLPTEAEWEYACRGNSRMLFPWGDQLHPEYSHMTNIWQGQFPQRNTEKDGFPLAAPVRSFLPNSFGLYDFIGNVWEWVDGPWEWKQKNNNDPRSDQLNPNVRIQKGGSFLCHRNHCFRYRCAARTRGTRDSTASNLGFRCAASVI